VWGLKFLVFKINNLANLHSIQNSSFGNRDWKDQRKNWSYLSENLGGYLRKSQNLINI